MAEVAERCPNFRVISEKSVKQWILTCDVIYTGNSSTIVEAFFAGKMCYLLFPYDVTDGFELKLISKGEKIRDYDQFYRSVIGEGGAFPIEKKAINDIYLVDDVPSYVKFADMAEEVLRDPSYALTREQLSSYRKKQPMGVKIQKALQRQDWFYDRYRKMLADENCHNKWIEKQRALRRQKAERNKRFAIESTNEQEIAAIVQKIAAQLDKSDKK